jgi:alpha-1,3-mannosylglycoprotein beta-1,4-N-acetylglucosaminyltransferase A/B
MVLGVPTVKREVQSYLLTTLHNLVQNLNPEEQSKTLIIVFVAETDLEYVESVAKEIEMQ